MKFSHSSLLKSLQFAGVIIVLSIVGVVLVTFGKSSTEVRTKAAQEISILKQWTFDSSAEGWTAKGIPSKSGKVNQGAFEFMFQAWDKVPVCPPGQRCPMARPHEYTPSIRNADVKSTLKYPVNMLRVRMAVTPEAGKTLSPFYLQLDQTISGKPYYGVNRFENIVADGKEHEYRFKFPKDVNLKKLETLEISFQQLGKYSGGKVVISDIALIGMKTDIETTPTPHNWCKGPDGSSCTYDCNSCNAMGGCTKKKCINTVGVCKQNSCIPQPQSAAAATNTIVAQQKSSIASKSGSTSCPVIPAFSASTPIQAYQFTYPSVVRSMDDSQWLMVTGGIVSLMPESVRSQAPGGASHIRYGASQEELWIARSKDLITWSQPSFAFNILPETSVAFKESKQYKDVFSTAFKSGCNALPNGNCNVQINDPSVVKFNGSLYMYFTILENYRWYDGSISLTDTAERNRHSIGLAVSNDDGKHWAFVDKIIPEQTTDTSGKLVDGAWAPSAIVVKSDQIDLYFHDAFGTKQYVAQLSNGVTIKQLNRLNKNDSNYRVNVDVIRNGSVNEMVYNDENFNIVRTFFTSPEDFGSLCTSTIVVGSNSTSKWPTPHQVIDNGKVHLFFWEMGNPTYNHHWIRSL